MWVSAVIGVGCWGAGRDSRRFAVLGGPAGHGEALGAEEVAPVGVAVLSS